MKGLRDLIIHKSSMFKEEVIRLRRHFHQHPELSYQEHETASYICAYLGQHGIKFRQGIAGTGIIATIEGNLKSKTVIAARAEMDALPVNEETGSDFSSLNQGKMHACGHDAHMAMLLVTGRLLYDIRDQFGGTILLIFQPGEEKSPGGAKLMLESGAFSDPLPDLFIAQHVLPELESGKVGYRPGHYMASCDEIYITVEGKGGHAALPHLTTDQVFIASKLVVRLKEAIKYPERVGPGSVLLGIGKIAGEGATNVIPAKVEIAGTLRTFDGIRRIETQDMIRKIAAETAGNFNVNIEVRIEEGYPPLINNEVITERAIMLSSDLLGKEKIEVFNELRMSSDDFSFYSQSAPSLYFRVGIKNKDEKPVMLHSSGFTIDEEGLPVGVANLSWLIVNFLSDGPVEVN